MSESQKWTIVIIMSHDTQTYFEYTDLEQSIIDQQSFNNRYVIFYYDQVNKSVIIKELFHMDNGGYAFRMTQPVKRDIDIFQTNEISKFLKEYVVAKDQNSNIRYMVMTWGHAAGLGFFRQDQEEHFANDYLHGSEFDNLFGLKVNLQKKKYNRLLTKYTFLKTHLSFDGSDELFLEKTFKMPNKMLVEILAKRIKIITATALNQIFVDGFGQGKMIDVLITINCYTQMLETGYELKDTVKLLVAPQASIPISGINFRRLFDLIEKAPDTSLEFISKNITSGYWRKYNNKFFLRQFRKRYPEYLLDKVSISCNLLGVYDQLMDLMNSVATELLSYLNEIPNYEKKVLIRKARENCEEMDERNETGIIDVINFMTNLILHLNKNDKIKWKKYLHGIKKIRRLVCLSQLRAATRFYKPSRRKTLSPYFISIFFPVGGREVERILKEYYFCSTSFTRFQIKSKWDEFLIKYTKFKCA